MQHETNQPTQAGGVEGGLTTTCHNRISGEVYSVSTIPQPEDAYWTTVIFHCVVNRTWFGLTKTYKPAAIVRSYGRNSKEEAYAVHQLVSQMAESEMEENWNNFGPDPMPPDGFNPIVEAKLIAQWGTSLTPEIRARFRKPK